jgi:hypothetical protein
MKVYIAGAIGFFIGTFFGVFVLGLMQMVRKGDDIYEKLILEQGRAKRSGVVRKSINYFDYFNPHRDRRVLSDRRAKLGKDGGTHDGVLHVLNGNMGGEKGIRG